MPSLETIIRDIGLIGVVAIVFAENGLLVGFFLPGDSLLFTAGFLASQGYFDVTTLTVLVVLASIVGVSVGYAVGQRWGRRLFQRPDSRFFKRENLEKAHAFYERHGGLAVILARFIPVVRTFAPVVAGIAAMRYVAFTLYNVVGGILWAGGLTLAGYWLGTKVEGVDRYLLPIVALIIVLSILPGLVHMLREPERRRSVWTWFRRAVLRQR